MKFHDLVQILDSHSDRYDEVACFARHLDPQDVAVCVGTSCRIAGASESFSFGFAYGNVWRVLRVEVTSGIVVLSSPEIDKHTDAETSPANPALLHMALQRAAAVPVDKLVPYTVRQEHFALLRKREGVLHRNLLMEWREIAGARPSSSGKWMIVDLENHSAKAFLTWVRESLWADVAADLGKCKMDLGLRYPFPGVDAHPDKRGGELCVEGTNVRVAGLLEDLVKFNLEAYARGLGMDPSTIRACVNGLADWLGTQNWTKPAAFEEVDAGLQCPHCGAVFLVNAKDKEGRFVVRGGHAVCPECARAWPVDAAGPLPEADTPVEKRCGTCSERGKEVRHRSLYCVQGPDGPPWDNCRFWKPKEKQP